MISPTHADAIRRQVRRVFEQFGAAGDQSLQETFLVRDGLFCGRRFEMDDFSAVWFVEEDELKFYDRDGAVVAVESPALVCESSARRAA